MDFELSRMVEKCASQEAEIAKLRTALAEMNRVVNHQTDRPRKPMFEGLSAKEYWMRYHPLTCGNDSNHTILFPYWSGNEVILVCKDCDYEQKNASVVATPKAPATDDLDADHDVGC